MHELFWAALAASGMQPPLVIVDAGHGGDQHGAAGVCDVLEKDITLTVSDEVAKILTASGRVRVEQTRTDDATVDLEERPRQANAAGAAIFLSIHANSSPNAKAQGVETFFLSTRAADR